MNKDSQWSKKEACFAPATQLWLSVNHNTSVTAVNQFDVRSVLHRQEGLAAINQVCIVHEAICLILYVPSTIFQL